MLRQENKIAFSDKSNKLRENIIETAESTNLKMFTTRSEI